MAMKLMITGGAGFIGSAVVRRALSEPGWQIVNVDKLTYAGNLESLPGADESPDYWFSQTDVCDGPALEALFADHQPDAVLHLAAESHVDRSIDGPAASIKSNIIGTYTLLEVARSYYSELEGARRDRFRFHHVSTDEVFGSLGAAGLFTEATPYAPNSPYSASKASSDHLVRAWHHTYGLPTITTNCSNNYGPYQFPEKLIPLVTLNALEGKPLPVYGKGDNVRDWLFVEDHAEALLLVLAEGSIGETYNIGGRNEKTNLEVVEAICDLVDELRPDSHIGPRRELIEFVADRPGHDFRYAIDSSKIERELGFRLKDTFDTGLRTTIQWYLENQDGWCRRVQDGSYRGQRLGLGV